jgi:excisionase family DNA binding protein
MSADRDDLLGAALGVLAERVADLVAERLEAAPVRRQRLLTVEQAAEYLGRSRLAVEHMIASGRLPVVRADRRVFLDVKDLDRWIESNKQPGLTSASSSAYRRKP